MIAQTQTQTAASIRWMLDRDLPAVLEIGRAGSATPWSEGELLEVLRRNDCIGMVDEAGDRVVGYMVYRLRSRGLEVLDFAVHPGYRRLGIGRRMVDRLVGKLTGHRRTRIVLRARETNLAAQLFFRACGFAAVRVDRGHFGDGGGDAYVMAYRIRGGEED